MKAVIAAGSPYCYNEGLREAVAGCDLFICADYGARRAVEIGVRPDIIIGDFDSASEEDLARLDCVRILRHPKEKDATDLELCVLEAAALGAGECEIFGATGGRADHCFANLHVLLIAERLGVKSALVDESTRVSVIAARPGGGAEERLIEGRAGDTVSIIPISETCVVSLKGFFYPLNRKTLTIGSTLGVSNVIESVPCAVTIEGGAAAVFLNDWGEPHYADKG